MAPVIFVQEPVPVGEDCHWNASPAATVYPDAVSVKGVLAPPYAGEIVEAPALGVPLHGTIPVPDTVKFEGHDNPPPVIATLPL